MIDNNLFKFWIIPDSPFLLSSRGAQLSSQLDVFDSRSSAGALLPLPLCACADSISTGFSSSATSSFLVSSSFASALGGSSSPSPLRRPQDFTSTISFLSSSGQLVL